MFGSLTIKDKSWIRHVRLLYGNYVLIESPTFENELNLADSIN